MAKTISLDIQKNLSETLDISGFFRISEVHAIAGGILKPTLDQILLELPQISLSRNIKLSLEEDFSTYSTLDLIHPDVIKTADFFKNFPRSQTISLNPDLKKLFWSLDIRSMKPILSVWKYADLFTRALSPALRTKKFFCDFQKFTKKNQRKIIYTFAAILMIFLPMIWFIKFSVESGYNRLLTLASTKNMHELKSKINASRSDFERAEFLFLPFSWLPFETVDLVNRATSGGKLLTSSLDTFLYSFSDSRDDFSLRVIENDEKSAFRGASKDIFPFENLGVTLPTNMMLERKHEILSAFSDMSRAGEIYKNAPWSSKYAQKMRQVGSILSGLDPILQNATPHFDDVLTMLGHKEPHRYMIFNQNRDEIRANGGFPGSIVTFTLYKGNILDYRTDDVYYYDWNLFPHKETPPPGIALLSDNYGLRDVNYYPDFRDTLLKANSFVEKSGDSTLTTAIAIHQGLIEDILWEIGEVKLDGVEIPFTKENFSILMSVLVENKFAKEKTPKDILFRFIDAFGKKIVETRKIDQTLKIIENHWKNGEILIASRHDDVQKFLQKIQKPLPWNAEDPNWIYPVFTSVSGNKSDRYIDRTLEVKTRKLENCTYETTVLLTQEHIYSDEDRTNLAFLLDTFGLKNGEEREKMKFIQWDGINRNFVRYFVPKDAILTGSGAEISEDQNAKIFSFMLETRVGGKSEKTLTYTQEIPNCSNYDGEISIFRQPWLSHFLTP